MTASNLGCRPEPIKSISPVAQVEALRNAQLVANAVRK
jgi:hypothetical protein